MHFLVVRWIYGRGVLSGWVMGLVWADIKGWLIIWCSWSDLC